MIFAIQDEGFSFIELMLMHQHLTLPDIPSVGLYLPLQNGMGLPYICCQLYVHVLNTFTV